MCQHTAKHATKFRAPMQSMPIIEEAFTRIAMDIVGPLERSTSWSSVTMQRGT